MPRPAHRRPGIVLGVSLALGGLGAWLHPYLAATLPSGESTPNLQPAQAAPPTTTALLPSAPGLSRTADGRHYPLVPADPGELAALLARVEAAIRSPGTPAAELPDLGHQQQVIYRVLSHKPQLSAQVRRELPPRWQSVFDRHLAARREFLAMHRGGRKPTSLPAWRIIAPEPPEVLIGHYKKAEAATGIAWEVLAAVNLVETGMGRIDGVSVANAQGPMQFLPTTWSERGIGKGDIRDPHDAIQAAARYLVRRGGLQDIRKGLWGYNNSDHYGRAVLHYASLIKEDPRAYLGLYHWEIHFGTAAGDLWLPVGYDQSQRIPVTAFLQRSPASAPPPGSSGY
ncbi:transglycosylase SLT domain-containing protein [Cyanobium sp. NIES-981]|uniref:transglycosylase SLT domain-containing protein n=1 Tax=Cyanobium sp. NIES-981 TaxID=1851505 RepID=UPI0007DD5FCD|nr:transglycosylase SLT domain-containing protein [Cyanobium sp. NIES-981]SBO42733.1 Lytic transglycosylase, catalytic [Cyanobium sp. NIES-981]